MDALWQDGRNPVISYPRCTEHRDLAGIFSGNSEQQLTRNHVALLASYLPARHAIRVDPMTALRAE